jgi:aminoglycoside phosphotransferase (APT) family kinase protein
LKRRNAVGGSYLGALERQDPLYEYLVSDVMPRLDRPVVEPVFHVSRMPGNSLVYRYTEEGSGLAMIGKFFTQAKPHKEVKLEAEYDNLSRARSLGLAVPPNYVVQPLGREKRFGLGLLEEFVNGRDLDHYVRRAAYEGRRRRLMKKLGKLASFLAELHKRTETAYGVDLGHSDLYFAKVMEKLRQKGIVGREKELRLMTLRDIWLRQGFMRRDREVLLHGDATPTNFIFPASSGVVAIDLERMRPGDRMYDVGMVCGELKHAFMWRLGDRYASEPFIGHFLKEYCSHFGRDDFFIDVTMRVPFYMAMTELRIARNSWLDNAHRKNLVEEAGRCLEYGLVRR